MTARTFLKVCNSLINLILSVALILCGAYGVYALWDNQQVLTAAEDVQQELLQYKPTAQPEETGEETSLFAELMAINPDVCGWISMEGTAIDYPVLQGRDNLAYINTDVYGDFSLSGSIFLDSRNDREFTESYSLLYGHYMADGGMFGDLDRYKEEGFFRDNSKGLLMLPGQTYELEIISCMLVGANDEWIFTPDRTRENIQALLDYAQHNSLLKNDAGLEKAKDAQDLQILALSTCASEFTDARTVVLTVMTPLQAVE